LLRLISSGEDFPGADFVCPEQLFKGEKTSYNSDKGEAE
jgi:hypothetical protein